MKSSPPYERGAVGTLDDTGYPVQDHAVDAGEDLRVLQARQV